LAAVIGLMAWMEISAMLFFVGAAWNSESATRADSDYTTATKTPGC
jgi:uncharacterized BrkB/YihY/UPF0761 family membrane protein